MGFSLKNIGSRIWDQVNMWDDGRTWKQRTPTPRNNQPTGIPYKTPVDTRSERSKRWDQINPFDGGRTYKQATPTTTSSVIGQGGKILNAAGQGWWRGVGGVQSDVSGFIDLVTPGTGTSRYTKAANKLNEDTDRRVAEQDLSRQVYFGGQVGANVAGFRTPSAVLGKAGLVDDAASLVNKGGPVVRWATKPSTILDVATDASQGAGFRAAREQDVSPTTVATDIAASTLFGGTITAGGAGFKKIVGMASDGITPVYADTKPMKDQVVDAYAETLSKGDTANIDKFRKEAIKQLEAGKADPAFQPFYDESLKAPKINEVTNNRVQDKGATSVGDALDIERFKQRAQGETPQVDINEKIAQMSDEDFTNQMMRDLGISKATAKRIVSENNKPAIVNNLYRNKDFVKNAKSPSAYAYKIMTDARAKGTAAMNQNMPPTQKPEVILFDGKPHTVESSVKVGNDTKYLLKDENGKEIWTNEAGYKSAQGKPKVELKEQPTTGKTYTVYRGSGGEKKVRTQHDLSILGNDKKYYAFDEATAKNFGDKVESTEVTLNRPLEITSDDQWRTIAQQSGNKYALPTGLSKQETEAWIGNITKYVESQGYDGVVIKMGNGENKLLSDVFGSDQVVPFNKTDKPTVKLKEEPVTPETAQAADGQTINTATGEVVEPPRAIAADTNEFIATLPDPKQTTRADADIIIGEGTDRLRRDAKAIEEELIANGDTWENFYRAIQQASDDFKAKKEPNVSPFYQELYDKIKPVLDDLREASGVATGETPYYLPRMLPGAEQIEMGHSMVDAIDAATMGSQFKRTGALDIDDTDLTPESLARYATQTLSERYRHSMAVDNILRKADERGTPITPERASEVVDMQNKLANDLADAAKVGKDFTNDTVSDLNKIGETEGIPQRVIDHEPSSFAQSPENMLKRARVWEEGFKQYDYAHGYGNEFIEVFTANKIPAEQFGDALRKSIISQMPNADMEAVDRAVGYAIKNMERNNISPENAGGLAVMAFRNVAKDQMLNLGKNTVFTGNKMRKVVNEQLNGRLLYDAHENNFLQGFDSFLTERINVSLRGLNVMSALFELGDISNVLSNYGVKNIDKTKFGLGEINGDTLFFSHKYGEADASFLSSNTPEISKMNAIWANPNTNLASKTWQTYRTAENKLLFFRYIEQHKTELFFRTAEEFYRSDAGGNLSGGELVNRVMSDYKKTMLPYKLATANRIVGKMPKALTQYANWGLQATKRMGRTLSGTNKAGKFRDMDRAGRIARGIGTELVPKATAAALLGIPVMQILGLRDFTGATNGDFTGIDEEDKNTADEVVQLLSLSPVLSVGGNFYFANRRNQIADANKAAGEDYNTERRPEDAPGEVAKQSAGMLIPFKSQYDKTRQVLNATSLDIPDVKIGNYNLTGDNRGYYENRDGRIQAEGPQIKETVQGAIFGKNYTPTMREYQDNPNIVSVIQGKAKPQDLITHNETVANTIQNFGGTTPRDYNRPLTANIENKDGSIALKGYSDMAKEAFSNAVKTHGANSEQSRKVMQDWIKNGREYNRISDNLRRNNPAAYETWIETKDGDVITPEKWRIYDGNRDVFEFDKQRKTLEKRDLKRVIDPIYELPKEQANEVLQERSAYTGDDMKLRQLLYSKDWYVKFKDAESKYFETFDGKRDETGNTDRVKKWNEMNKQVFAPEGIISKYPLVSEYQAGIDKFENYNSQERKDFTSAWYDKHGDAYTKQKEAYDNERWNLVNEMRKIEGTEPITFDEFKAKVEFPDEKNDSFYGYSRRGGGGGGGASIKYQDPSKYSVSINSPVKKAGKPKVAPKVADSAKKANIAKPKVTIKKSKV